MTIAKTVITRVHVALAACLMLASCGLCGDEQQETVLSPDHVLKATYFVRDCGATTSYSSIVNVQRSDEKFNPDDTRVFVARGEQSLSLEWTGPRTLLVKCSTCSRKDVFQENIALGDIDINYMFGSSTGAK
jgi:hypothetical protein